MHEAEKVSRPHLHLRGHLVQQGALGAAGPGPPNMYVFKGPEVILMLCASFGSTGNMDQTPLSLESERSGLKSQLCHSLALLLGQIF